MAFLRLPLLLLVAVLLPAQAADAQEVRGSVTLQGSGVPVPDALVSLLDTTLVVVARARTDAHGEFAFARVAAGTYLLQAELGGVQTPLSPPVEAGAEPVASVRLELPSPFVILALTCGPPLSDEPSTVLVGSVRDRNSGVPLPGAELELAGTGFEARGATDAAGNFRFCDVPVGMPLALAALAWGRRTATQVTLVPATVNRADLAVDLGTVQLTVTPTGRRQLAGGAAGLVVTLRDAVSGSPLRGAAAGLGRAGVLTPANDDGLIRFPVVEPGDHDLTIEQVGYGRRSVTLALAAGEELHVDIRVPPQPVALDPIGVRSEPASERSSARTSSTRVDVVAGEEMAFAEERGASVADVVRQRFPGLLVSEGAYSTLDDPNLGNIVCVESIRRMGRLQPPEGVREPYCEMVVVVHDGIRAFNGGAFIRNMSARDVESMQYLGPLDAGGRYGVRAGETGALLIWSRGRGPYQSVRRTRPPG